LPFDVAVSVKSVKGHCDFGCKVGDKILFDGRGVKGDICYSALMAILPKVYALRYGAEFPWAKEKDAVTAVCPDPENPVLFEIRRIRKK
jgi:uncharacterized repeat protein (TIGR04076 family)